MKKFIDEFKNFAFKGNVIDMAVGIVIGGAFSAIATALVNYIIMPLISFGTAGIDFTDMKIVLRPAQDGVAECAIGYGQLIQSIIYFLLVSLSLFIVLKIIFNLKNKINAAATTMKKPLANAATQTPGSTTNNAAANNANNAAGTAVDKAVADTAAKATAIETREANIEMLLGEIRDLLKKQQQGNNQQQQQQQ